MPETIAPHISFSPASLPHSVDVYANGAFWHGHPHTDMAAIDRYVAQAKKAHAALSQAASIVVIGTGGSTLGAKMLTAFGTQPERVWFVEMVDAAAVQAVLRKITLSDTLFMVISKSGATVETLSLYNIFAQHYAPSELAKQFVFISDPTPSPLRQIAAQCSALVIDHPKEVGGRYSVLTPVGLLPALFAGVDVDALVLGAGTYQSAPSHLQSTSWHLQHYQQHKTITVMMPYIDRLSYFTHWWRQLWAESLGKEGHFTTPFAAMGSVDQHSQLQQWLDGRADKSFVLISADEDAPLMMDGDYFAGDTLAYLSGQNTQSIQAALMEGTLHALTQADLPWQHMHFETLTVKELGWLVMHCFAEIICLSDALGISPYGQPAVESGKLKTKALLVQG